MGEGINRNYSGSRRIALLTNFQKIIKVGNSETGDNEDSCSARFIYNFTFSDSLTYARVKDDENYDDRAPFIRFGKT